MNKQIYAFIIPFVVLLILGFTPLVDMALKGFKDEINIEERKWYTYLSNERFTVRVLNEGFKHDLSDYKTFFGENISEDENVTMHLLNYVYYLNQRSIAMVKNHKINQPSKEYDEDKLINAVMQYDYLARIEYQCVLDSYGETDINIIGFYKSKGDVNDKMARLTYGMMQDFAEDKKKKAVKELISKKCSTTIVYKEQ